MGGTDADVGGGVEVSDMDTGTSDEYNHDDPDFDGETPFHFFTVRNFIAFFTLFGWTGIAGNAGGLDKTWTIIVALVVGLLAMLIVASLFYFIGKMVDAGGELDLKKAINKLGTVYIPIKANTGNVGKIQINLQGAKREMQAINRGSEDLTTGTVVKVVSIYANTIFVVEKFDK